MQATEENEGKKMKLVAKVKVNVEIEVEGIITRVYVCKRSGTFTGPFQAKDIENLISHNSKDIISSIYNDIESGNKEVTVAQDALEMED